MTNKFKDLRKLKWIKFSLPFQDFHKQQWRWKSLLLEQLIYQSRDRIWFFSPQFLFRPEKLHGVVNKNKRKKYQGQLSKERTLYLKWRGHYVMAQYCQRIDMTRGTWMIDKSSHIIHWRRIKGCLNTSYKHGKIIISTEISQNWFFLMASQNWLYYTLRMPYTLRIINHVT
jgi:hypothetical protein